MERFFIGINSSFHDASVCVVSSERDEPVLMLSEDRHSGIPHHFGFPFASMRRAIAEVGAEKIAAVGTSRNPACFRTPPASYFADILSPADDTAVRQAVGGLLDRMDATGASDPALAAAVRALVDRTPLLSESAEARTALRKRLNYLLLRYGNELTSHAQVRRLLPGVAVHGFDHHLTHAAFYLASPFDDAAVITWDGRGEFDTTVLWHGHGDEITRLTTLTHPVSLGSFYEIFAEHLGLGRVEGPGKLMGLAAYGDARFEDLFRQIVRPLPGAFGYEFDRRWVSYSDSERMAPTAELVDLIGVRRQRGEPIEDRHAAIAHAVQAVTEDIGAALVDAAMAQVNTRNVVLSGGLTLNCVMNEKLRHRCGIEPFVLPPSGDDGTALGAALLLRRQLAERPPRRLRYVRTYGTQSDHDAARRLAAEHGLRVEEAGPATVAALLAEDKVLGVIQGAYEFGPRALGFRSILADPRKAENWPRINGAVKFREDFRPFAPVMLREEADRFWGSDSTPTDSPFMLLAPRMSAEAQQQLGAVVHKDRTARVQTVAPEFNPWLHQVLGEFKGLTGVGVLMNTSLNMSGESIIIEHLDLLRFLAASGLDAVVLDGVLVRKQGNQAALAALPGIADRQAYLAERPARYRQQLTDEDRAVTYLDFDGLFAFLFAEGRS